MKKIIGLFICLFFFVPFFYLPVTKVKAESSADISCSFMDPTMFENVNNSGGYYQTFYPTKNRLTKIVMHLAAFMTDSTATMKLLSGEGSELASASQTVAGTNPASPADYTFEGFSVTITPGNKYQLVLIRSAGATLYWYKTTACAIQGNLYANGTSWPGADYVFTSYGYNAESDQPASDTSIAAPTDVKAEYVTSGNKVKVSWTKTATASIDGYRIYRSEVKTKDFAKVGLTDNKTFEYFDTTITASKTYYYYVKAYKSGDEGASSDIAEVKIPATAKTTPTTASLQGGLLWLYLLFGGVGLLLIIFLIIYELKLKKMWAKPKKGEEKKEETK